MEFKTGQVVLSKAGRDKDKPFVITGFDENYVLICDGKERKLEKAKKKNPKHLQFTSKFLDESSMETNRKLFKALKELDIQ